MKILRRIVCGLLVIIGLTLGLKYVIKENFFPYKYKEYVDMYSKEYDLDPYFVLAIMKTESNFNEKAHSHMDAVGLMQVTTDTAEWAAKEMELDSFSQDELYTVKYNIRMGCWYLRWLSNMFDDDKRLMIAAYNAGPTNVSKWLKSTNYSKDGENLDYIPFGETKKYVDKVEVFYNVYHYLYSEDSGFFDVDRLGKIFSGLWSYFH